METQRLNLTGIADLRLTLTNCEGCTVNGHKLEDLLALADGMTESRSMQGNQGVEIEQSPGAPPPGALTKRRASDLLDQTELVLDHIGDLDDVATNVTAAVHETIASSGQKGLMDLFDAAQELKTLLVQADRRVAKLSHSLSKTLQLDENEDDEDVEGGGRRKSGASATAHTLTPGRGAVVRSRASSGASGGNQTAPRPAANPLEQIFPKKIVEALSCDVGDDVAEHHPSVTVLMSDIVGFTAWCSEVSPTKVIECLSSYFQVIDDLAETFGVYKVETVGDGYQAITGAPVYNEDHAEVMALFALKVIETLPTMRKIFNHEDFDVRVGINSGPIVTGVIRADRIRWQLFGDTVNVASRMESTSVPGRIQISKSTRDLLLFRDSFEVERRGLVDMKGKGQQETFFLNSARETNLFHARSARKSFNLLSEFVNMGHTTEERVANLAREAREEEGREELTAGAGASNEGTDNGESMSAASDNEDPASPRAPGRPREKPKEPTVLLVDDLLSILLQYTRVLQREGIKVVTAKNGLEGLEQLKHRSFTCCFCDIHMPKMDGIEMVKAYRAWEEKEVPSEHKLPLFALTGNTDLDKNTAIYLSSGFDEVISKTNYKDVLLSYVQNCMD